MTAFRATYYDGLTSEPAEVEVRLDAAQTLHVEGMRAPIAHPLSSVRISPRLGNTRRSLYFPDGAKCESDDQAALDTLELASGRGKLGRFVHTLESRWRYAVGAAVLLFAVGFVASRWGIPLVARQIADAVPARMAYDLSRGTLQAFDRTLLKPSRLSAERQQQLSAQFELMARHYPSLPLNLKFRLGMGANAFALPDGTVVVTDELVKLSENDEEVLAVLAHEIGHVHYRHSLRMALESSTVVMLISTYLGDVTQLTTLSAALPGVYAQAHYSRELETEADTFALHYLDQSRIPHQRLADILRRLQKTAGPDPDSGMQYLASHPPTTERIRRFEK